MQYGSLYEYCNFTYDGYGRRLSKVYSYDPNPGSTSDYSYTYTTTYDYDTSGRLIHETCVETTTYTGGSSSTKEITYLYDETGIVGAVQKVGSTETTFYFDKNIKGDVIGIYNASGTKIANYSYDTWGNCTTTTLVSNSFITYNSIRYRGYYYDRETRLYYLNARYYDPAWRRFISPDHVSSLNPSAANGLNLYSYANNNPVSIAYSNPSIGGTAVGAMANSVALGGTVRPGNVTFGSSSSKDWIHLKPVPSWVETAINIADIGFSASIVGLTAWYTLKYPGVADLMKLDGITSIPGKYSDFVEVLGYAFVFVETGIDIYNNWQQGQSAGYIIASGAYTFATGMAITWGSAKLGACIGTAIGGPAGFIIGGLAGIFIGIGLELLSDEIKKEIF